MPHFTLIIDTVGMVLRNVDNTANFFTVPAFETGSWLYRPTRTRAKSPKLQPSCEGPYVVTRTDDVVYCLHHLIHTLNDPVTVTVTKFAVFTVVCKFPSVLCLHIWCGALERAFSYVGFLINVSSGLRSPSLDTFQSLLVSN
jgi:hypothetical protein